uniref:DUF1996 domain-containing protein n=1 Tax=Panagrellus redivivus TaxID=6233 RepID=A0A7E4UW08_PANRE
MRVVVWGVLLGLAVLTGHGFCEDVSYEYEEAEPVVPYDAPVQARFAGMKDPVAVPHGVFHYAKHESDIGSKFRLPDETNPSPFDVGGRLSTKDSTIDGFYLPMPMGMDPINFQLMRAVEKTRELDTAPEEVMTADEAYSDMKVKCRLEADSGCEEAMRRYYDLKLDQSIEESAPVHEKLIKLSDILSRAAIRNDESNDIGVLFGAPGFKPISFHTNLGQLSRSNIRVE